MGRYVGVPPGRIEISGFCRFLFSCLATGCHAFGFKIATAAMRPRNDTELERFYLENGRFYFIRPFCAVSLCDKFETFRSENRLIYQQSLPILSLRGGLIFAPDAAIFDGTKRHPGTKFGETEQNSIRLTCTPFPCASRFLLPCFATGCHTFGFKIATAAMRPRNDTKS